MKDDVTRKNRVVMSIPTMATGMELLKTVIVPIGEKDGKKYVAYKEGHSDQTIAEELSRLTGEAINENHIQNLRTKLHGDLKRKSPMTAGGRLDQMQAQIDALKKRLAHFEEWATTPGNKPYVRPVSDLLDTWED